MKRLYKTAVDTVTQNHQTAQCDILRDSGQTVECDVLTGSGQKKQFA